MTDLDRAFRNARLALQEAMAYQALDHDDELGIDPLSLFACPAPGVVTVAVSEEYL